MHILEACIYSINVNVKSFLISKIFNFPQCDQKYILSNLAVIVDTLRTGHIFIEIYFCY